MLDFENDDRQMTDKELNRRLLKYFMPHFKEFIFSFLFMIITIIVDLTPPLLLGVVLDLLPNSNYTNDQKMLYIGIIVVVFIVVVLVSLVTNYFQTMILQKMGQKIILRIRGDVFNHIESLSISQINAVPVGKLVTRVMNDADSISQMFTSVIVNLIQSFVTMIVTIVILLFISVKLTLITMAIIPFVLVASYVFRSISRKSYRRIRDDVSSMNAFLSENLSGMKITQIYNQEEKKRKEYHEQSKKLQFDHYKEIVISAIFRPIIYLLSMIGLILVLYFGAIEVFAGILSYGILFSFYNYVDYFFNPIQNIAEEFNNLQNAYSSAEKIFSVLDFKPSIVDSEDAIELEEFKGNIEFKNVWFQYIEDEWVLKNVSFTVSPDETVAFVGATGSGKTTILSLIVRNYDIQKGEILIDGINIKEIKMSSLRSHIGQMLQDVFLFNDTIKNNITLNNDNISLTEVIKAAEYVGANNFIEKLPKRYDDMVLERGNNFSSGQRQLISFARAIVYQPSLMILDEATANIDSETEELIQDSLHKMMNISTMLIVAHRLSTIQHSDKIIVLNKGEIMEMGNHQELLKLKGMYYDLYKIQFDEMNKEKK
ncbi:MAG TPA: ABC transporter ATP-binding protein [Haploplasma sp.]|nr:ABC transporter ATP-binding protein [Haploplasma sp.]